LVKRLGAQVFTSDDSTGFGEMTPEQGDTFMSPRETVSKQELSQNHNTLIYECKGDFRSVSLRRWVMKATG
jgi:hypothetical protein